jgi:fermentation-respiration switch protein FrsA (DUF1100 family)
MRRLALATAAMIAALVAAAGCSAPTATPTTAAPATSTSAPSGRSVEAVTFRAADAVTVRGTVFGSGTTGIVLSNMGDNDPAAWERFAPDLAGEGYTVLTYTYRYPARPRSLSPEMAIGALNDAVGAAAYLRSRGATRIVLIGASLGGMVTAKTARSAEAAGVAIIAAPADRPDFDLSVTDSDLAGTTGPKLFVASDNDPTVAAAETRGLYDRAAEPKTWKSFPGTAHGTQLFDTEHAADFRRTLVEFVAGLP